MSKRFGFEPEAREIYLALRKDPQKPLYRAIKDVLTQLLNDPGSKDARALRYRPDTWGIRVEIGDVRWLILWRPSTRDPDLIEIHYIGPSPGES